MAQEPPPASETPQLESAEGEPAPLDEEAGLDEAGGQDDFEDLDELLDLYASTPPSAGTVLGGHIHLKNEVMASYHHMRMAMIGNRKLMYGVTGRLTVMAMTSYKRKRMRHVTRMGARFTTETAGMGDAMLGAHFSAYRDLTHEVVLTTMLSLPTGSIDEKDGTPMGVGRLPYPMQLGSGTWDLLPSVVYTGLAGDLQWGVEVGGTIRLGRNDNHYRLGDEFRLDISAGYAVASWLLPRLGFHYRVWGNIHDEDPGLNPAMVPTADPNRRSGQRLDMILSVEAMLDGELVEEALGRAIEGRFVVELMLPLYQYLDGPQLESDWGLKLGAQVTF
jgi:hypothetical protein